MKRLSLLFAMLALLLPGMFSGMATAASSQIFTASLNAAAEHPGVVSPGTGDARIVINAAGTSISYTVNYINLSGPVVAGHIHIAAVDANGPVSLPFTVGPSPIHGTLTAANFLSTPAATTFRVALDAIRSGRAYVNLHTADHPGGEVRGQLWDSTSLEAFGGTLSGGNESPAVTGGGTGAAQVLVDRGGSVIHIFVNYSGLSGDLVAAHIHIGAPGANGPVSIPFKVSESPLIATLTSANFVPTTAAPTWADAIAAIRSGNAYVNLHTAAHPGGEVRANLTAH